MQLINAIILGPEDDLDFRMHLRNEFSRLGLLQIIDVGGEWKEGGGWRLVEGRERIGWERKKKKNEWKRKSKEY